VRDEVLDGRVGRGDPPVAVRGEAARVVEVHLDEILVEAVGAAAPAAVAVHELPVREPDVGAQETRERLAERRGGA
jgi:hypothetical protein